MSFENFLIHTCVIENAGPGKLNVHGNEKKDYMPAISARCRLVEDRERVWNDERGESAIQSVYKLFFMNDVDITERAKISSIALEDSVVLNGKFVVTELFVRRGRNSRHKMAALERVS
jgi:hypothetical protein